MGTGEIKYESFFHGDLHGNIPAFRSVLQQYDLKPDDKVYIVGDAIDRRAGGIELVKEIHELQSDGAFVVESIAAPAIRMILLKDMEHRGDSTQSVLKHARNTIPKSNRFALFRFGEMALNTK